MEAEGQSITTTPLYGLLVYFATYFSLAENHRTIKILVEKALAYNTIFQKILN
jgi:hypothetical protein